MANVETAFGLRPVGLVGAGVNSTGVTEYEIASNNTNAIYQYGLVTPTAAGVIDFAGSTSGGTTAALGVLTGILYQDSIQKKPVWLNFWPGSGAVSVDTNYPIKAYVADNPNQLFVVAADATLTDRATALAGVFANASLGTSARTLVVRAHSLGCLLSTQLPRCLCALLALLLTFPTAIILWPVHTCWFVSTLTSTQAHVALIRRPLRIRPAYKEGTKWLFLAHN